MLPTLPPGAAWALLPCAPSLGPFRGAPRSRVLSRSLSFATAAAAAPLLPISAATLASSVPGPLQPARYPTPRTRRCSLLFQNPLRTWRVRFEVPPGLSSTHQLLGWQPEPSGPYSTGLSPDGEPNVPGRPATHHLWCTRPALANSRSLLQTPRAFLPQGVQFSTV